MMSTVSKKVKPLTLRTGFEPARQAANGFQVHLLNHSDTSTAIVAYVWIGIEALLLIAQR